MMRRVALVSSLVACGPSSPSEGTETDGGTTAGASGSTTSGAASTSGGASTGGGTTGLVTTGEVTTTTGEASTTAGVTTGGGTTGETTGGVLPSCCETPGAANAEVTGTTPLGPIALTWAWFGILGGECGGRSVYVYEDPSQVGTEVGPRFVIFVDDPVATAGTFPASFTVYDAQGMWADVAGKLEVTMGSAGPFVPEFCAPGDPVVRTDLALEMTFSIVADGWDVTGTVTAPYCPQLNVFCP